MGERIVGYSLYGRFGEPNPPSQLVQAVAIGDVDIAIVWGPFAGYFAKLQPVPLTVTPVSPAMFLAIPFTYKISAAVRKGDNSLRSEIQEALARECTAISELLLQYRFPQLIEDTPRCDSSQPAAALSH
jgi:hypothetical protein